MKSFKPIEVILALLLITAVIFGIWHSRRAKPAEETVKDKIFSVLAGFDFRDPQSFSSISQIEELGEKTVPVLQDLLESESISERWAAIILLPRFAAQNEELVPDVVAGLKETLDDSDATLRMLSAVQLASLGEKEGIRVLIDSLSSEESTHFGSPPELIRERALVYLRYYTGFEGASQAEWQAWWQENQADLFWNKKLGVFEINQNLP
jgi:HEAT repeat protein